MDVGKGTSPIRAIDYSNAPPISSMPEDKKEFRAVDYSSGPSSEKEADFSAILPDDEKERAVEKEVAEYSPLTGLTTDEAKKVGMYSILLQMRPSDVYDNLSVIEDEIKKDLPTPIAPQSEDVEAAEKGILGAITYATKETINEIKQGFIEAGKELYGLAKEPYGVAEGIGEFLSKLPGFGLGILSAAQKIGETLGRPNIDLLDLYESASDGMIKGMKVMEPLEYKGKVREAELVAKVAMAPMSAIVASVHELAEYSDWLKEHPNAKGALYFGADIGSFVAFAKGIHKARADIAPFRPKVISELKERIIKLKEAEELVNQTPDRPLKNLVKKEIELRKNVIEEDAGRVIPKPEVKVEVKVEKPVTEIPKLEDTEQAEVFGRTATPEQLEQLKTLLFENYVKTRKLRAEGKHQEAATEALPGQFYREALEEVGHEINQGAKRIEDLISKEPKPKIEIKDEFPDELPQQTGEILDFLGLQKGYEFLKTVKAERAAKVKQVLWKWTMDNLIPTKDSPLDKAATEFLLTGDIQKYIDSIPTLGEMRPGELAKFAPEVRETMAAIAVKPFRKAWESIRPRKSTKPHTWSKEQRQKFHGMMQNKGMDFDQMGQFRGYVLRRLESKSFTPEIAERAITRFNELFNETATRPAVRGSGFYAPKIFETAIEKYQDISKRAKMWSDPTRLIQEIDQGKFGDVAQRLILWPARRTILARLGWQDAMKAKFNKILEKHKIVNKKKSKAVGDVLEFINEKNIEISVESILKDKRVSKFVGKFNTVEKHNVLNAAKETRKFFDDLIDWQNQARGKRKQDIIPYRKNYKPWIIESNLLSNLMGYKWSAERFMEKPEMPDFIQPNKPFNPRELPRHELLRKYPKERKIHRLMSDYIDVAGRDIFNTNVIHNNKVYAQVLKSKGLPVAADAINTWTAEVFGGIKPKITKAVAEHLPERMRTAAFKIRRGLTRAVFPLNWTWNVFIQTSSAGITFARYGGKANIAGLKYFTDPMFRRAIKQNAYSHIIKSRWGGSPIYQDLVDGISKMKALDVSKLEKAERFANFLTQKIEDNLTGHAIAAAYYDGFKRLGLQKGSRELWEYASEGGAKTQSMYNFEDLPGVLRAKEAGVIAPFQTFSIEVFNTVREMNIPVLKRLIGKAGIYETIFANSVEGKALMTKRLRMLAEWTAAMIVINAVGEKAIGRKPWEPSSFVPFLGLLFGRTARAPITGILPAQYLKQGSEGFRDIILYGNFKKLRKWMIRYHMIGGIQIERMIEGVEANIKGEVTDVRGNTLFSVDGNIEELKSFLMGPFRTEEGKEYLKRQKESRSFFHKKED